MHGASGLYKTLFCDGGKNNNHRCSLRRAQGGCKSSGLGLNLHGLVCARTCGHECRAETWTISSSVFEFKAIQFVEWRCWCFTCCSSSLYPGRLTLANPQAFWWRERISFKDSVWNTALDGQQSFNNNHRCSLRRAQGGCKSSGSGLNLHGLVCTRTCGHECRAETWTISSSVFEFKAIQFVEWRCWCFTCCSSSLYPGRLTLANPQAFWWRERISFKDSVWNTALDGQQSFV
ncbi:hypothetical protein PanWU01x14_191050 [Parasponia andersonii]|uniref:Uncharacterized protein n=1 Tax=Parasponia andersonii TaxID=3476 RepID=A0A2P5C1S9_PARAD|nr:hypothetical protein PanWU01x14_191050 [Parasponia andersonii]